MDNSFLGTVQRLDRLNSKKSLLDFLWRGLVRGEHKDLRQLCPIRLTAFLVVIVDPAIRFFAETRPIGELLQNPDRFRAFVKRSWGSKQFDQLIQSCKVSH